MGDTLLEKHRVSAVNAEYTKCLCVLKNSFHMRQACLHCPKWTLSPAAADTIYSFLNDTGTRPEDYDRIFTGDLGVVGSELLHEIMLENGVDIEKVHDDCGLMLYDLKGQDVHAGGSGCGCSASVLCGYIFKKMEDAELSNIIFAATGALMSPTSQQQGCSIPGICHAIHIKTKSGKTDA